MSEENSKITLPDKPQSISLVEIGDAYEVIPVEITKNFVVGIRQVTGIDLIEFEKRFKCNADRFFLRLVNVIAWQQIYEIQLDSLRKMDFTGLKEDGEEITFDMLLETVHKEMYRQFQVKFDEENNVYDTPQGKMYGSVELNMIEVLSFALSRVGKAQLFDDGTYRDDDGTIEWKPVSEQEVLKHLTNSSLSKPDSTGENTAFWEIMRTCRLFDIDKISRGGDSEPVVDEVVKDDEPGNAESAPKKTKSKSPSNAKNEDKS